MSKLDKYVGLKTPYAVPIDSTDRCVQLTKYHLLWKAEYLPPTSSLPPRLSIGLTEVLRDTGKTINHPAKWDTLEGIKSLVYVTVKAAAYYTYRRWRLRPDVVKDHLIPVIRKALDDGIKLAKKHMSEGSRSKLLNNS